MGACGGETAFSLACDRAEYKHMRAHARFSDYTVADDAEQGGETFESTAVVRFPAGSGAHVLRVYETLWQIAAYTSK